MKLPFYFLAIFSLAMAAPLVRLAQAPPEMIGFWRLLAAAAIMLPLAFYKGALVDLWRERRGPWPVILLSAVFFFAHLWTYFYAAQNTRIANCMILFATNPLFTAFGARFFFQERFTRRHLFAYLLAALGIFQLVQSSLSFDPELLTGDLSALLSAVLFSGYLLTGKRARQRADNLTYSGLLYAGAAICFGLFGLAKGTTWVDGYPPITWLAIAGTVLLPTLLGHALFSWLMASMNINLMSCGKLMEPALSALVAWLAFGENLRPQVAVAFVFTAASVTVLFSPWQRPAPAEDTPRSTP